MCQNMVIGIVKNMVLNMVISRVNNVVINMVNNMVRAPSTRPTITIVKKREFLIKSRIVFFKKYN